MKKLFDSTIGTYSFDASEQTITFSGTILYKVQILSIINLVDNILIYKNNISGKDGSFLNNVLTLNYDTSNMNDTDTLQIFIWTN
jgi:hypothetical protein